MYRPSAPVTAKSRDRLSAVENTSTTAPASPASPASWTPLPCESFHTKPPTDAAWD